MEVFFFMENSIYDIENGLSRKISSVALWMSLGLFLSAVVAAYIYFTGTWIEIAVAFNGYGSLLLLGLQLGLVIILSSRIRTMNISTARWMFIGYSVITGINFSVLPVIYEIRSIFIAFGLSAIMFLNLAIIANRSKTDMTKWGSYLFTGLIMLILINVVGFFFNLSGIEVFINYGCSIPVHGTYNV